MTVVDRKAASRLSAESVSSHLDGPSHESDLIMALFSHAPLRHSTQSRFPSTANVAELNRIIRKFDVLRTALVACWETPLC